uniref:WSC domain-containing protein n=1 Tax=Macrostomum lignano TaxID=282301 RepID=A0A1I8GE98_9PLAT
MLRFFRKRWNRVRSSAIVPHDKKTKRKKLQRLTQAGEDSKKNSKPDVQMAVSQTAPKKSRSVSVSSACQTDCPHLCSCGCSAGEASGLSNASFERNEKTCDLAQHPDDIEAAVKALASAAATAPDAVAAAFAEAFGDSGVAGGDGVNNEMNSKAMIAAAAVGDADCALYVGCRNITDIKRYTEADNKKYFEVKLDADLMNSVSTCAIVCSSYAVKHFGLRNTDECWCGDLDRGIKLPPKVFCDFICPGSFTDRCGDQTSLSVYEMPVRFAKVKIPAEPVGCYISSEQLKLKAEVPNPEFVTHEKCSRACWMRRQKLFGFLDGVCHCGNQLSDEDAMLISMENCEKLSCPGNAAKPYEFCGTDGNFIVPNGDREFESAAQPLSSLLPQPLKPLTPPRPTSSPPAVPAVSALGLSLAVGFQCGGLRHGWSALVTAVPAAQGQPPAWTSPQFDWFSSGDTSLDYLVMATFSSESPQQQQLEGGERSRKKRFITLTKYPLKEQPVQLPPASSSGNRKKQSSFPSASEVRILTAQAETSVACNGRLIGLYCTAGYVAMAIRQRDNNIKIQIYNCDLWPISSEQLLRNPSLVREATEAGDIVNEKVQCVTVDKAEQTLMYFHTYRLISAGNKQMRRLCSISLPDLQVHRRLQLKDDVKSIKVGSKFFALYFRDCRLAVYCKSSRSVVFEFSAQKLGCLFLPGDTFELDSQDRLVEVSEKRVRSLFYNGVTYRDCDCANLQELISGGRRRLIGRRAEFYEALQCHLATLRLGQQQQQQQ